MNFKLSVIIMDILFLNLPYEFMISRASRWPEKTKSGTLYYPYWISYCVGVCEEEGFDCKLVDCTQAGNIALPAKTLENL